MAGVRVSEGGAFKRSDDIRKEINEDENDFADT